MTTRVLLADDNPLAREAVTALLKGEPEFEVIGAAADGLEALALARDLMPDLILMDINMPNCDGLLATRLIKRELPYVTVVILTVSDDASDLFEAIKNGAQGYLLKHLEPRDWLAYLHGVVGGESMPRGLASRILAEFGPGGTGAGATPAGDFGLTEREQEVLRLVAAARTNKEVAAELFISEQTVKNHIKNIMQKLHLKSRVELALHAQRTGLDQQAGPRPD